MQRKSSSKHVAILLIGTLIILLGSIIAAVGAFRSVMHDPKDKGSYLQSDALGTTAVNYRHYVALISYFPEIFNCGDVEDIYENTAADVELRITDIEVREAATFYCWRESGDAVWLYAFGFVILFIYLILAFSAAFKNSGHRAALAGIGFSAIIIGWAFLVIVHFQEHNNIPAALRAFGDCENFASVAASRTAYGPWGTANTRVTNDYGLEILPSLTAVINRRFLATNTGITAAVSGPTDIPMNTRAFYYSRRGGTDIFDETLYSDAASAAAAALVLSHPVAQLNNGVVVNNVAVNTLVTQNVFRTTNHGTRDGRTAVINFSLSPARIFGPSPRRAWLCNDDVTYDSTLRITQNLVYGGIATLLIGALIVLTAFAYLAHPILGVVKAPDANAQRAANIAADYDAVSPYYDGAYTDSTSTY